MKICKRVFLRIKNKPANMILLSGIFVVVSTLLFVLFGFLHNVDMEQVKYQNTIPGGVVMRVGKSSYLKPTEGYAFDEREIETLFQSIDGHIENKIGIASAFADSFHVKEEDAIGKQLQTASGVYTVGNEIPNITVMGISDSTKHQWFTADEYRITMGSEIKLTDQSDSVALISQGLAKSNDLKIGNTIYIQIEEMQRSVELIIKGIFSAQENEDHASRTNAENRIIIPIETFEKLVGMNQLSEIDISLDRASDAEKFQGMIKENPQMNIQNAQIITNNYEYVKKSSLLMGVRQYLVITSGTLLVSTLFILGLYIIYQNMMRSREFMILLSRGASCGEITTQVLIEIIVSFIVGNFLSILLCVMLCRGGLHILQFQSIGIQFIQDIINMKNLLFVMGLEILLILIGNSITFFNLLQKQQRGRSYI